jgi:hypothetical protein
VPSSGTLEALRVGAVTYRLFHAKFNEDDRTCHDIEPMIAALKFQVGGALNLKSFQASKRGVIATGKVHVVV